MRYGFEVYKSNSKLYLKINGRLLGIWSIVTFSGSGPFTLTIPMDIYQSRKDWVLLPAAESSGMQYVDIRFDVVRAVNVFTITRTYVYADDGYSALTPSFLVAGI